MSELTLTILRLGLLVLLWLFVFSLAGVLRGDLYGTRVVSRITTHTAPATPVPAVSRRERRSKPATGGPRNLVVTSGPLEGTRIPLGDNDILIGRNAECLLVLDDDFASGRHAAFVRTPDGWAVEDLGSTNGTFVDGERIAELVGIAPGNEVQIGRTTIELQK
ncbi:FHA domain-containing protein FhaB/FipA [Nostocoides jenkinsii]|uniref:Putative membrane protein n=1 Tax=Nostocoides jenkinsii Ben 74 TaxID=1193518 RepID=A0A077MBF1_9MICO|nr:FHA domain-containing protein [Tetrasphaera jenkinsii]CCI51978.1 putative membrane protein [Tetrasphaera jenkinsii Ben 74]